MHLRHPESPRRPLSSGRLGYLRRIGGALVLAAGVLVAAAPAQPPRIEKAALEVVADRTAWAPGEEGQIAALMTIEEGWHTNSHTPSFEYLIPTVVAFELPAGWGETGVAYPPGELKTFAFEERPLSVYQSTVAIVGTFAVPADAAPGPATATIELSYQACDDNSCLPPVSTTASLEVVVGTGGVASDTALFTGGDAAAEAARAAGRDAGVSLAWVLLLGVLGGLILNAMPCVLPVLSLKVFGLVKAAGQGRSQVVVGALATAAGILISFWALAAAAVAARSAGAAVGWGVQFQEPVFVTALAVVVILFCLNLWGLFEIPLPVFLARAAGSGPRQGVPGHFVSGLFATLMATPCSAPFLGTAVGFALAQPAGVIFAVFTAVGTGMALPYLALAAAPRLAGLLPRPGAWMETLKIVMGFLLAGAAIWLFYVLAAQVSAERVAFIELALLSLALGVWLRSRFRRPAGQRFALAVALAAAVGSLVLASGAETRPTSADRAVAGTEGGLIEWTEFDEARARDLAAAGTPVFVDVTADWCFTCKVNENLALDTPEVAEAFERHGVVAMKADWTNRDDVIAAYLASFGRYGIPFYALYRQGEEPHLFGELLTSSEVARVLDGAG